MSKLSLSSRNYLPLAVFITLSAAGFWWLFHDGFLWTDFPAQWRICVYTLRGMNIYSFRGTSDYLPEIGRVGAGFHATPWGLVLANLFYCGFLSMEAAKVYFVIINITGIVLASYLLFVKSLSLSREFSTIAFIISLTSINFFIATHEGNAGGIICVFLVIAWLICEEHPFLSGILISFAMVKPQDALIVCLAMLIMKNFIPVITAALIDTAAWFTASVLLKENMFELLREFLFAPNSVDTVSAVRPFAGIFSLVSDNFLIAVTASMIFGIIFVCVMYRSLPDDMPVIFKMYPAFMAVTFWCYSWTLDSYVLIIPVSVCLWLMIKSVSSSDFIFWMLCSLYCANGSILRSIAYRIFMKIFTGITYWRAYDISRTIYETGIIIIGIILCFELRRVYGHKNKINHEK